MSWSSVKLGDTCDVIAGGTPKRSETSYWGGDIPWVKISDMLEGRISQTEETITRAGLEGSSAKLLPPGTLLVSIFATIGRTAVLECEAATNQAIVGVIPRQQSQFDDRFLQYSLRRKTQELQRQGRGVAQANINGSVLKATPNPPPAPGRAEADCGDSGCGGRLAGQAPRGPRPARHPPPIHLPRHVRRPRHQPEGVGDRSVRQLARQH